MATASKAEPPADANSGVQRQDQPPISAIFIIYFDLKAGYTLGWRRSLPGVQLEGVVEYKSLPSGLHNVSEDLVYFVNDNYAGLSAYVNERSESAERNAKMLAVGILVPLSFGRLGRGWKHADALKTLVRDLLPNDKDTKAIEEYWEAHKAPNEDDSSQTDSPIDSPSSLRFKPSKNSQSEPRPGRQRSTSEVGPGPLFSQHLSPHHPALSLSKFFDAFGPLIFPIYRAALLRKRILLVTQAPVELACNYVYNISILSNIPFATNELLSPFSPGPRLRPLFALGVHDIPFLTKDAAIMNGESDELSDPSSETNDELGTGWVACTTDEILTLKNVLYDVVIRLPPPFADNATAKVWPDIKDAEGNEIKATQRDRRRYETIRHALSKLRTSDDAVSVADSEYHDEDERDEAFHKLLPSPSRGSSANSLQQRDDSKILEPLSWSALAYSSFMWWASAGEARQDIVEEEERDLTLFEEPLDLEHPMSLRPRSRSSVSQPPPKPGPMLEMALIAYFHRMTTLMLSTTNNILESSDRDSAVSGEDEDQDEESSVFVGMEDMTNMGLDVWSTSDRRFIEELLGVYFGRKAEVPGGSIECCGVKIAGK